MLPTATETPPSRAALLRIHLAYLWRHRRLAELGDPTRFTELVQLRKLYDRDSAMPTMADKVAIKTIVADRLGPEWVVPMLWSGEALPAAMCWNEPVVLKSRHGCRQTMVLRPGDVDWAAAERQANGWTARAYGRWLDEWLYAHIPPGLLIEPFIGMGRDLPIDYKIYVFGGQATHVQAHVDRAANHRWIVHDTDWRAISRRGPTVARPSALSAMLAAAEEMARGFSFARIDFYQPGGKPLFGEITFYPGSGLDRFDPPSLDMEMGRLWLDALAASPHHWTRSSGDRLAA